MTESASNDESQSQDERQVVEKRSTKNTLLQFSQLLRKRWPEYILEIIVVIIGITISFGLNNIKEDASNSKLEQGFIKGLMDDISSDIKDLEETIRQTEIVIRSGQTLLDQSDAEKLTIEKKEFVNLVRSIVERPSFVSKNATFSALKSSVSLQLIQDMELKNLLFDYDQQYQALKIVEAAEQQETVAITGPYIIKYIPLADSKRSDDWLKNLAMENILSDVEFVNNVILRLEKRKELLEGYKKVLDLAHQIQDALKRNLQ